MMPASGTDLVKFARVLKANGTDGETVIGLYGVCPEDINTEEPVFIYFDESPVPFFVESLTGRGTKKALVRLTGIRTTEDVQEILGADIYAERSALPGPEDGEDLSFLTGWEVWDKDVPVGKLVDFAQIPGNLCIDVEREGGEVVILPFHEDLILSLDEDSRVITMDLPSGLL